MIEERDGQLYAFEFKFTQRKKAQIPKLWQKTYPDSTNAIISRESIDDFL